MSEKREFIIGGDGHKRANDALRAHYATLDLSKRHKVTVAPYVRRRSLSQNALMWTWINQVADHVCKHTGMDAEDVHEFFKGKFLHPKIISIGGEEVESRSTKNLTTVQMKDYMDRIQAWAATDLGITLPLPEDQGDER